MPARKNCPRPPNNQHFPLHMATPGPTPSPILVTMDQNTDATLYQTRNPISPEDSLRTMDAPCTKTTLMAYHDRPHHPTTFKPKQPPSPYHCTSHHHVHQVLHLYASPPSHSFNPSFHCSSYTTNPQKQHLYKPPNFSQVHHLQQLPHQPTN